MKNLVSFAALCLYFGSAQAAEVCNVPVGTLLPDLMTVVPQQIGLQNAQQREIIRFSNAIANLGEGLWWLEPEFPENDDISQMQSAYQVFASTAIVTDTIPPADSPEVLGRCKKGEFAFHPSHNHWHINHVAEFKVCTESDFIDNKDDGHPDQCTAVPVTTETGTAASVKVTFCLIDWVKIGEKTSTSDPTRNFWECATSFQGITPGWADQYHHSTPDQQIDITGIAPGTYFIVTTANYDKLFEESDNTNNVSWMKVNISRNNKGNPKLTELESACDDANYYANLVSVVNNYTNETSKRQKIIAEMCGGVGTNK